MSGLNEKPAAPDGATRIELPQYRYVPPEEFAALTGANEGFTPAHPRAWMMFWQEDICEKDQFHTEFPRLSLSEARRLWLAMEVSFFARYDDFLRVWPEWCSSGIWSVPFPGSRRAGGMVDYKYLPLPEELVARFKAWQSVYDEHEPWAPEKVDWKSFNATADELARELKRCVGPRVYVERVELLEVLMDGTTFSWRNQLGLPERESSVN